MALLAPVVLAVASFACHGVLPAVPDPFDVVFIAWLSLSLAAEAFIVALYFSTQWSPPCPGVVRRTGDGEVWSGEICGTVEAAEEPFRGPDGRPCVAALRLGRDGGEHSRWTPFWVATERDRVLVKVAPDTLRDMKRASWRHVAIRPRWFSGGAWAPNLAPDERLDWVCVRVGDLVRIWCVGMHWTNGVEPITDDAAPVEGSPYRGEARNLEVELSLRRNEGDSAGVEVAHATMGHAWWRRSVLRLAAIVTATLLGCSSWYWADYASAVLGPFDAVSLTLQLLGAAMFLLPIAAWFSRGFVRAWSSNAPPPWMPGGKAEMLVDSPAHSWVELASRFRFFLMGSAALVVAAVSAGIFGFNGLVFGGGAIMVAGFLYAMFGGPQRE